jgi:hypothetical protein
VNEILFVFVVLWIDLDYPIQNVNDYVNVVDPLMIDCFQNDYDF